MRLAIIIFINFMGISFAQTRIYHQSSVLDLNKPISAFKVGDTLITFDKTRGMLIEGIFKSVKYNVTLDLIYKDSSNIKTINVSAVIKDSNLYWNGKCFELDRNSKHSIVRFFDYNKFLGVQTYYIRDQIQSVESNQKGNLSDFNFDYKSGKPSYYSLKDSTGLRKGKNLFFYENGELNNIINYENDIPFGEAIYYFENGTIQKKGEYLGDMLYYETLERKKLVTSKGVDYKLVYPKLDTNNVDLKDDLYRFNQYFLKTGKWEYFNKEGDLIKIEYYKEGILVKTKRTQKCN